MIKFWLRQNHSGQLKRSTKKIVSVRIAGIRLKLQEDILLTRIRVGKKGWGMIDFGN